MNDSLLLGIDIGGTKTALAIGNSNGQLHASGRIPSIHGEDPGDYVKRILVLAESLYEELSISPASIERIGISAPGPLLVETGTLLRPPNNPGWENVPIVELIHNAFNKPVTMNNDANAGVLAEYYFGEYRDCRNMVYLTCSTGIGSGIITHGTLVQGASDMGGEIGHLVLDPDGPPCPCGLRGCLELYCGGLNIARRVQKDLREGKAPERLLELAGGEIDSVNFEVLAKMIREGDDYALGIWDSYIEHLARAIGMLIMTLNPEMILLGTIGVHMADLLIEPLNKRVRRYAWSWNADKCQILPTSLDRRMGELSGIAVAVDFLQNPLRSEA